MKFTKLFILTATAAVGALSVQAAPPINTPFSMPARGVFDNSRRMFEQVIYNNQLNRYSALAPAASETAAATDSIEAFFTTYASIGNYSSTDGFSSTRNYTIAFVSGAQMDLDNVTNVGVAVNGAFGRQECQDSHNTAYEVRPVAFFGTTFDEVIDLDAAVAVGVAFNDASVAATPVNYNQYEISGMVQAGYRFDQLGVTGLTLEPVVGVYVSYLYSSSADIGTEKLGQRNYYSAESYVGGKALYDFAIGTYNFTAEGFGYWKHQYANRIYKGNVSGTWLNGTRFARDYAQFGLMTTMLLSDNMSVSANWTTNFSTTSYDNTVAATFNMTF